MALCYKARVTSTLYFPICVLFVHNTHETAIKQELKASFLSFIKNKCNQLKFSVKYINIRAIYNVKNISEAVQKYEVQTIPPCTRT